MDQINDMLCAWPIELKKMLERFDQSVSQTVSASTCQGMGMAAVEKHEFKVVLGIWFCPLLCDVLTGQWIKRALDGHQEPIERKTRGLDALPPHASCGYTIKQLAQVVFMAIKPFITHDIVLLLGEIDGIELTMLSCWLLLCCSL